MSMFTLAISCLTTSSLLWFMDLITFQVPIQYCSLQHQALLSSPVTSTTGCCFRFWISLFILSFVSVLMAQMVKCLPTMQETLVQLLGWEDPLEKKMTTHFSTLAWKIPRREEPSRLHGVAKSRTWLSDFIFLSFFILSGGISPLFSSSIYLLAFSYCSWGSQSKNAEVVCHSLLQQTTFYQNSLPRPICLGWPCLAWLIVSLSESRLWSVWSIWLVFYDCGFHSVCTFMGKEKRHKEAFWWGGLAMGESGSCFDRLGHAQ